MAADRGSQTPRPRRSVGRVLGGIAVGILAFLLAQVALGLIIGVVVVAADMSRSSEHSLLLIGSLMAIIVGFVVGARFSKPKAT
jgi:hypothetical protein